MLTPNERRALEIVRNYGGSVLISIVPDKTEKGVFGDIEPGLSIYVKLAKRGLVVITEEDPITLEDGSEFTFTPAIEITDEGLEALK